MEGRCVSSFHFVEGEIVLNAAGRTLIGQLVYRLLVPIRHTVGSTCPKYCWGKQDRIRRGCTKRGGPFRFNAGLWISSLIDYGHPIQFCPRSWTPDKRPANMVFAPHW